MSKLQSHSSYLFNTYLLNELITVITIKYNQTKVRSGLELIEILKEEAKYNVTFNISDVQLQTDFIRFITKKFNTIDTEINLLELLHN